MKKLLVVLMIGLMLVCTACSSDGKDEVFATINGNEIYQSEVDYYFASYFQNYYDNYYSYFMTYMGVDLLDEESAKDTLAELEGYSWDIARQGELISQIASDDYGITWEDNYLLGVLPNGNYRSLKANSLYSDLFNAVKEEMLAAIEVTDDDAVAKYNEDPTQWDSRLTSHILIKADPEDEAAMNAAYDKAMDLIQQLNDGADFAELAKANSDDGSASNGGALANYINAAGVDVATGTAFYAEYADAAFGLAKVGDYTLAPVKSSAGYHIIKVDEIRTGYDASADMVKSSLKTVSDEDVSARIQELIAAKEADSKIDIKGSFKYFDPAAVDDAAADDAATDDAATDDAAVDDAAADDAAADDAATDDAATDDAAADDAVTE